MQGYLLLHSMTRKLESCMGKLARLIDADIATLKGEIKLSNPKLAWKPVTIVLLLIKEEEVLGISNVSYEVLKWKRKCRCESTCIFYLNIFQSTKDNWVCNPDKELSLSQFKWMEYLFLKYFLVLCPTLFCNQEYYFLK